MGHTCVVTKPSSACVLLTLSSSGMDANRCTVVVLELLLKILLLISLTMAMAGKFFGDEEKKLCLKRPEWLEKTC